MYIFDAYMVVCMPTPEVKYNLRSSCLITAKYIYNRLHKELMPRILSKSDQVSSSYSFMDLSHINWSDLSSHNLSLCYFSNMHNVQTTARFHLLKLLMFLLFPRLFLSGASPNTRWGFVCNRCIYCMDIHSACLYYGLLSELELLKLIIHEQWFPVQPGSRHQRLQLIKWLRVSCSA